MASGLRASGSDRLKDEMGAEAGIARTGHDGPEEDRLEAISIIGEMRVSLSEGRNDLRHFQSETSIRPGERGAVAVRIVFTPFRGVRPNLDAHPGQWRPVTRTTHAA